MFMAIYYRHENARRDAVARERGVSTGDLSDEMALEREKGDEAEFFRYTV